MRTTNPYERNIMSDTTAPLELVIVDDASDSFVKELAKTTAINTAATAGTLAALVLVGFSSNRIQKFRRARAAKKAAVAQNVPPEA